MLTCQNGCDPSQYLTDQVGPYCGACGEPLVPAEPRPAPPRLAVAAIILGTALLACTAWGWYLWIK